MSNTPSIPSFDEATSVPAAPAIKTRRTRATNPTPAQALSSVDITVKGEDKENIELVAKTPTEKGIDENHAFALLRDRGFNPDHYVVVGVRISEWTMFDGTLGAASKYDFRLKPQVAQTRQGTPALDEWNQLLDEAMKQVTQARREPVEAFDKRTYNKKEKTTDAWGLVIGDTQLGKGDAGGSRTIWDNTITAVDKACEDLRDQLRLGHKPSNILIAWVGDVVEGFVSQGGSNSMRNDLGLTHQIRLGWLLMWYTVDSVLHALDGVKIPVSIASVPGNHDEAVRLLGSGNHSNCDSFAVLALTMLSDVFARDKKYSTVTCYTPSYDEIELALQLGNTCFGIIHGHQCPTGKDSAYNWLKGQKMSRRNIMFPVQVLLKGHHHQYMVTRPQEEVTIIQAPALEPESTYFRQKQGFAGSPGVVSFTAKDGVVLRNALHTGDAAASAKRRGI